MIYSFDSLCTEDPLSSLATWVPPPWQTHRIPAYGHSVETARCTHLTNEKEKPPGMVVIMFTSQKDAKHGSEL